MLMGRGDPFRARPPRRINQPPPTASGNDGGNGRAFWCCRADSKCRAQARSTRKRAPADQREQRANPLPVGPRPVPVLGGKRHRRTEHRQDRYLAPPARQPRDSSRARGPQMVKSFSSLLPLLEFLELDRPEAHRAMAQAHTTQQARADEPAQLAHGDGQLLRRFFVSEQAAVHAAFFWRAVGLSKAKESLTRSQRLSASQCSMAFPATMPRVLPSGLQKSFKARWAPSGIWIEAVAIVHVLHALARTVNNYLQRHGNSYRLSVRKEEFKTFRVNMSTVARVEQIATDAFRGKISANAIVEDCVQSILSMVDTPPNQRVVPMLVKQVDTSREPPTPLPEPIDPVLGLKAAVESGAHGGKVSPARARSGVSAGRKARPKRDPGQRSR